LAVSLHLWAANSSRVRRIMSSARSPGFGWISKRRLQNVQRAEGVSLVPGSTIKYKDRSCFLFSTPTDSHSSAGTTIGSWRAVLNSAWPILGDFHRRVGAASRGYNDRPVTSVLSAEIRQWLKCVIIAGTASVLGLTALAYAVDFAVFRYKVSTNRQPYGQVTVTSYDAVAQKSGRTQFFFHPPQAQTCVNALFPQGGYVPCWYLQRHAEQRTDI